MKHDSLPPAEQPPASANSVTDLAQDMAGFVYRPSITIREFSAIADNYEVHATVSSGSPHLSSARAEIIGVFEESSISIRGDHLRAVAEMLILAADVLEAKLQGRAAGGAA